MRDIVQADIGEAARAEVRAAASSSPPPLRLTEESVDLAYEEWGFNCGPGAICAVLGLTPGELRPNLGDFEQRGYTNPTLMFSTLRRLGVEFSTTQISVGPMGAVDAVWPSFGLARVQWGGPWTRPNVPMAARYRYTHWVASCRSARNTKAPIGIFDVNCVNSGGWVALEDWKNVIVPELTSTYPRADGSWWLTHAIEVHR